MIGFFVVFVGYLMGNVVVDDSVVFVERKVVVVVVDICVVVDRVVGVCKEVVFVDKMIVVVGKVVVGMVVVDGSFVVDKDVVVCNVVVLVGSYFVVDKEVVDKGVVVVDIGEGMVVVGYIVKDLVGEVFDERNVEDVVFGYFIKKKKLKLLVDVFGRVDCILFFILFCYLLCRKYMWLFILEYLVLLYNKIFFNKEN